MRNRMAQQQPHSPKSEGARSSSPSPSPSPSKARPEGSLSGTPQLRATISLPLSSAPAPRPLAWSSSSRGYAHQETENCRVCGKKTPSATVVCVSRGHLLTWLLRRIDVSIATASSAASADAAEAKREAEKLKNAAASKKDEEQTANRVILGWLADPAAVHDIELMDDMMYDQYSSLLSSASTSAQCDVVVPQRLVQPNSPILRCVEAICGMRAMTKLPDGQIRVCMNRRVMARLQQSFAHIGVFEAVRATRDSGLVSMSLPRFVGIGPPLCTHLLRSRLWGDAAHRRAKRRRSTQVQ